MQRRKRGRAAADDGAAERSIALAAKGVSKSQLQRICSAVGVQVSTDRLYEIVRREAEPLLYQEALEVDAGEPKLWDLYDPVRLVQHVLAKCPSLAQIYRAKLADHPGPWHVVVGFDEHVPGDKLKTKNLRKSMVLAFNFAELGEEVLQRDASWFIPIVLRASELDDVSGGWSQALKLMRWGVEALAATPL